MPKSSGDSSADVVTFVSPSLGEMTVPRSAVLTFVEPMLGFAGERQFALLPAAREGLWWLISITEPCSAFILADPFVALPEYDVALEAADQASLALTDPEAGMVLVMLTLPSDPSDPITANLKAPIVANVRAGTALQIVSSEERYSLKQAFSLAPYPLRAADDPDGE